MKKISHLLGCTVFIFVFLISGSALIAQSVTGNGNVVEKERNLSGFDKIESKYGVDVHIQLGSSNKVVVKTDENLQEHIKTEVEGSVLKISSKGNIRKAKAFDVYVTLTDLKEISAHSGSDVYAESTLKLDKLNIEAHSGSDIHMELEVGTLTCLLNGGSDAFLKGSAGTMDIEANGGSDISAKSLKAGDCKLDVSGGSDARVYVTGKIEMKASGGSDIYYSGNPEVLSSRASGSSDIHGN